ncbi:MAG: acetylglutamate kinase [Flavobacteriales bacterium]|nr:acetylglutamate kinase [Flavobacteriales bacterium]
MKQKLKVYKIGGGIIDNSDELRLFLSDFSKIQGNKILIHGGGKGANQVLKQLGIEPKMIEGRRVTDKETLDVVISFYAGTTNKNIVATLQSFSCNALGLSGADANAICGIKRPVKKIDYGFVGDITAESVNTSFIDILIKQNITPVFCAITHDGKGNLLNTNADTISACIASSLAGLYDVELHYCFDKIGVLKDVNNDDSLISEIDSEKYKELLSKNIIHDGMIPKLKNAFNVINSGVNSVILEHPKNLNNSIKTVITK